MVDGWCRDGSGVMIWTVDFKKAVAALELV